MAAFSEWNTNNIIHWDLIIQPVKSLQPLFPIQPLLSEHHNQMEMYTLTQVENCIQSDESFSKYINPSQTLGGRRDRHLLPALLGVNTFPSCSSPPGTNLSSDFLNTTNCESSLSDSAPTWSPPWCQSNPSRDICPHTQQTCHNSALIETTQMDVLVSSSSLGVMPRLLSVNNSHSQSTCGEIQLDQVQAGTRDLLLSSTEDFL